MDLDMILTAKTEWLTQEPEPPWLHADPISVWKKNTARISCLGKKNSGMQCGIVLKVLLHHISFQKRQFLELRIS